MPTGSDTLRRLAGRLAGAFPRTDKSLQETHAQRERCQRRQGHRDQGRRDRRGLPGPPAPDPSRRRDRDRPDGTSSTLVAEVQQHLGDDRVRAVAMDSTDGLARGTDVVDTGAPISVPVGEATLGRIWNVIGQPVDDKPAPPDVERWSIHREPPAFRELTPTVEIFETGIKVIDLIAPYIKGGKVGLFGGAGVGKTGHDHGAHPQRRERSTAASRCSRASASAPARATTSTSRWRNPAFSTRPRSSTAR